MSAKSHTTTGPADDAKKTLQEVGKKIFVLWTPWPLWTISGCWIAGASDTPATGNITATDDAGREILSYVPLPLVADFLSNAGQSIVSRPESRRIFSILINNSNDPQVTNAMSSARSSHINRLRNNAAVIFGPGFDQNWFPSKFNRGSIEKLQELLGAHMTPKGKKYLLLPPILFPDGSQNKRDVFLNPALIRVSALSGVHSIVY